MSHELTQRANGFVEMAYVGDAPWHGLANSWYGKGDALKTLAMEKALEFEG